MQRWEKDKGIVFLRKIGIKIGQKVLDFGARSGHYSIPAALTVGNNGVIYAVDKEKVALDELEEKTIALGLHNIKIIRTHKIRLLTETTYIWASPCSFNSARYYKAW